MSVEERESLAAPLLPATRKNTQEQRGPPDVTKSRQLAGGGWLDDDDNNMLPEINT